MTETGDLEAAMTLTRDDHSLFADLMEEPGLLEAFIHGNEEELGQNLDSRRRRRRERRRRRKDSVETDDESEQRGDPEEAFLAISGPVRSSMKKHLPLGMLEVIDDQIVGFFQVDPDGVYVAEGLSSYQRLLAHACCAYNGLASKSKAILRSGSV